MNKEMGISEEMRIIKEPSRNPRPRGGGEMISEI